MIQAVATKWQDAAVEAVAQAVLRTRAGLGRPSQPIGSFLFLGPTGVGKTELAKALAEELFDDESHMVLTSLLAARVHSLDGATRAAAAAAPRLGPAREARGARSVAAA